MTDDELDEVLSQRLPHEFVKSYERNPSDKGNLLVFTDWLLEQGLDVEPVLQRMKDNNERRIRRENMEEVLHEQGNLETQSLNLEYLTEQAPHPSSVPVTLSVPGEELSLMIRVPADHGASIQSAKVREGPNEPWYPMPVEVAHQAVQLRHGGVQALFARAERQVEDRQVPYVGFEGELLYPEREGTWGLWSSNVPEHLQRGVERDFPESDFITHYTDGGGFQSDAAPGIAVDGQLYQLVRDNGINPEVECPFKDWDSEHHEEERNRSVTDNDTLWGESPHQRCRFCEAELGEEHGMLYVGEGGEYVYASVPDESDSD